MKKKAILILLLLLIISLFFIPVTQQKNMSVKGSFFNVYTALSSPDQWVKWRSDLRNIAGTDSTRVAIQKGVSTFSLTFAGKTLNVKYGGNSFIIDDDLGGKSTEYEFTVEPRKYNENTSVTALKRTSLISYLLETASSDRFTDTHITDLKRFIETDSLHYGYKIVRNTVPDNDLIEIKKEVLTRDKFTAAAGMLASLQAFIKTHNVKQMQPVIAQFLPRPSLPATAQT